MGPSLACRTSNNLLGGFRHEAYLRGHPVSYNASEERRHSAERTPREGAKSFSIGRQMLRFTSTRDISTVRPS